MTSSLQVSEDRKTFCAVLGGVLFVILFHRLRELPVGLVLLATWFSLPMVSVIICAYELLMRARYRIQSCDGQHITGRFGSLQLSNILSVLQVSSWIVIQQRDGSKRRLLASKHHFEKIRASLDSRVDWHVVNPLRHYALVLVFLIVFLTPVGTHFEFWCKYPLLQNWLSRSFGLQIFHPRAFLTQRLHLVDSSTGPRETVNGVSLRFSDAIVRSTSPLEGCSTVRVCLNDKTILCISAETMSATTEANGPFDNLAMYLGWCGSSFNMSSIKAAMNSHLDDYSPLLPLPSLTRLDYGLAHAFFVHRDGNNLTLLKTPHMYGVLYPSGSVRLYSHRAQYIIHPEDSCASVRFPRERLLSIVASAMPAH